ncbi:uncharacterized protein LOC135689809 [Rhopilema esculentum]|uniref:uncharacterized protein LOC135689809 n=1 Tax=Rhopilema esculentum TaxID=499914 RepID=UPI0031D27103
MEQNHRLCEVSTQPVASITKDEKRNAIVIVKPTFDHVPVLSSSYQASSLTLRETCLDNRAADATKVDEHLRTEATENIENIKEISNFAKSLEQEDSGVVPVVAGTTVLTNEAVVCAEELNTSVKKARSSCSLKRYRTKPKERQRSDSLPLYFANLSVADLTLPVYVNNSPSGHDDSVISDAPFLEQGISRNLVAVTPPPTYRSLIKQTLADIPPSYESVTGLSLNVAQDPSTLAAKSNSRNSRSNAIQPQSKIIIIVIISIVILTTLILVLAEAFTTM